MKEEILDIAKKLYHNHLTPETATNLLLDLFGVMHRSFQGSNRYAIEHLINDTYQVVDRVDGTVHYQGTEIEWHE